MPTLEIQSIDPRAGSLQPAPEGLEFRVATPLWGPYYQASPYLWSDLPQESFYNPRTYPFPAVNSFLPQRSGAFIQPGQADPLAYQLVNEGSLDGLGQASRPNLGSLLAIALGALALSKKSKTLGLLAVGAWLLTRNSGGLLGRMGQIADRDWFPEDPTGGAYFGTGDDSPYPDVLGPGESVAVASNWIANLHPRGFAATA